MRWNNFFFLIIIFLITTGDAYYDELVVPDGKNALDLNLFENVLDPELCEEQLSYIVANNTALLIQFLDAGIRLPRGIVTGNLADLGNYHQCLGISGEIPNSVVHGKYCMITVSLDQELQFPSLPEWPWQELNPETTRLSNETAMKLNEYNVMKSGAQLVLGTKDSLRSDVGSLSELAFQLAVCIPKTCTTKQAIDKLFFNVTSLGFEYQDNFCRLPNDKQWVVADYVAIGVFSLIGLLTILSTSYDLIHTVHLGKDPKKANKLCQSFSLYTNTRRLVSYTPIPGAIECLDGIRSLAMMWVIIGHTFFTQLTWLSANPLDSFEWISSYTALWVTSAPITVDTFFTLSGLLLVYTTAGKFTGKKLLKSLHLFYLNRFLRMFPVLAAVILLQASLFNWVTDGPLWSTVVYETNKCRVNWWSTMLYVQNYVHPVHMCLGHSWYLAIDMQLHILSPLALFSVLSDKKYMAWITSIVSLLFTLISASVYIFLNEFPGGLYTFTRPDEQFDYFTRYYINTITRSSPFYIGMIYGYLLHLYREKQVVMYKFSATILWFCTIAIGGTVIYSTYPVLQLDWDNQTVDSIINSYMRPAWALGIGWMVVACAHGYGGPVNWFLSHRMWKLLSRLSYALYLVHYQLMLLIISTSLAPIFFSVSSALYEYLALLFLSVIVAFILTVLVDSPCTVLVKHFMGGGPRNSESPAVIVDDRTTNDDITEIINGNSQQDIKTKL